MTSDLAVHLRDFFQIYLREQRDLSSNTVKSYRDTFKLFIRYMKSRHPNRPLTIKNLDARTILAFLQNLEDPHAGRSNSARTRNHRLAAIQSFFKYLSIHRPSLERHCKAILTIPRKRVAHKAVEFLSREELEALLAQPQTTTSDGIRDLAMLTFLYNTGARAQEAADARTSWFDFNNRTVNIMGKGKSEGTVPLWPATVELLLLYRDCHRRKSKTSGDCFFVNQRGMPFTRFGIRTIVKKYLRKAARNCPSIAAKRLSTHSLRHTTATHLTEAGVESNVLQAWLRHRSLRSSDPYRHADLKHKRRILEQFGPPSYVVSAVQPKQNDSPDKLLDWLKIL